MLRHKTEFARKFKIKEKNKKFTRVGNRYQQEFAFAPQRISINRQWIKKIVEERGEEPTHAEFVVNGDVIRIKLHFDKSLTETSLIKKIVCSGKNKLTYNFDCVAIFKEFVLRLPPHHSKINKKICQVEMHEIDVFTYTIPQIYYEPPILAIETEKKAKFNKKRLLQKIDKTLVFLRAQLKKPITEIVENKEKINRKIKFLKQHNLVFEDLKEI